jgi:hypothetical protein
MIQSTSLLEGNYFARKSSKQQKGCIRNKLTKLCLQASASSFDIKETTPASTTHPVPISSFLGHIYKKKTRTWQPYWTNMQKMFRFWCLMHFFKEIFKIKWDFMHYKLVSFLSYLHLFKIHY